MLSGRPRFPCKQADISLYNDAHGYSDVTRLLYSRRACVPRGTIDMLGVQSLTVAEAVLGNLPTATPQGRELEEGQLSVPPETGERGGRGVGHGGESGYGEVGGDGGG